MDSFSTSPSALAFPAPDPGFLACDPQIQATLQSVHRRLRTWRAPPNWFHADWSEEVCQVPDIAAYEALATLAPSPGVPGQRALYDRIIARARTAYRREWTYYLHNHAAPAASLPDDDDPAQTSARVPAPELRVAEDHPAWIELLEALEQLPPDHRNFIEEMFIHGRTETELAAVLHVSQRAASKRKQKYIAELRQILRQTLRPAVSSASS